MQIQGSLFKIVVSDEVDEGGNRRTTLYVEDDGNWIPKLDFSHKWLGDLKDVTVYACKATS